MLNCDKYSVRKQLKQFIISFFEFIKAKRNELIRVYLYKF